MADGPREDPRSSAGVRVPDMGAFAGHVSRVLTSRTNYESCVADSTLDSTLYACAHIASSRAPRSLSSQAHRTRSPRDHSRDHPTLTPARSLLVMLLVRPPRHSPSLCPSLACALVHVRTHSAGLAARCSPSSALAVSLSLPLGLSALVHPSNVPPCPPLPPSAGSHSHASPGPVARGLPLSLSRSHACSGLSAGFAAARPRRLSPSLSLPLRLALSCTRSGLPAAPPGLPARPSAAAQSLLMRVGAGAGRSSGSGS